MSHFACIAFKLSGKVATKCFTRMVTLPHDCIHAKWIAASEEMELTFMKSLSFLVVGEVNRCEFESVITGKGIFN